MNTVSPVTITTPDGVERELRFTLGARKRISSIFGMQMKEALDKFSDGAIPGILFALLHDSSGKPPDVTIEWLEENLPNDSGTELLAAIMSAATQGRTPKNELEDLLKKSQEFALRSTTSTSGLSARRSSESQPQTSGTDSSSTKSSRELKPTDDTKRNVN